MFVTSFSNDGYERYGRNFLNGFLKHSKEKIIVYYEGIRPDIESQQIEYRNLYKVKDCWAFILKVKPYKEMAGKFENENGNYYDYRFDAFRFARKVFVVEDAARNADFDTLIWIDADIVFLKNLPDDYGRFLTPDDEVQIVYVGRKAMHSECGLVVYNHIQSIEMRNFFTVFANQYRMGAFTRLNEWNDCWTFDHTRLLLGIKCHNLAENIADDEAHQIHPMCYIPEISDYLDHLKGPTRKEAGISPEHPRAGNE